MKNLSNEELVELYGLYKQATVGDINIAQPWAVQVKERAKWDAWNKNKGELVYVPSVFPDANEVSFDVFPLHLDRWISVGSP